jgi:hypothetical protein
MEVKEVDMNEQNVPFGAPPAPAFGKLAAALAKAQLAFPAIKKDKKVTVKTQKGTYYYSYADLADVIAAVRKPLADAGLAFTQITRFDNGKLWLVTCLIHESGQSVEGVYPLPDQKALTDPQGFGSALTYAKRYGLSAILGIATEEDDDGKTGSAKQVVSPDQVKQLKAQMDSAGKTADDVKGLCKKVSGQANPRRLTPEQFAEVFKRLGERELPTK